MLHYDEDVDSLRVEHLTGFFEGWALRPSPETHLKILRGSSCVVLARDGADGPVVGFVTALSDGVLAAYVPLLEVLPDWRGRGIASELMRRLRARLAGLYMVDLVCDEQVVPFYERLGMRRGIAMAYRNREAQAGRFA